MIQNRILFALSFIVLFSVPSYSASFDSALNFKTMDVTEDVAEYELAQLDQNSADSVIINERFETHKDAPYVFAPTIVWPDGNDRQYALNPLDLMREYNAWSNFEGFSILSIVPLTEPKVNWYAIRLRGQIPDRLKGAGIRFHFHGLTRAVKSQECAARLTKDDVILIDVLAPKEELNEMKLFGISLSFPEWEGISISLTPLNAMLKDMPGWDEAMYLIDALASNDMSNSTLFFDSMSATLQAMEDKPKFETNLTYPTYPIETNSLSEVKENDIKIELKTNVNHNDKPERDPMKLLAFGIVNILIIVWFLLSQRINTRTRINSQMSLKTENYNDKQDNHSSITEQFYAKVQELDTQKTVELSIVPDENNTTQEKHSANPVGVDSVLTALNEAAKIKDNSKASYTVDNQKTVEKPAKVQWLTPGEIQQQAKESKQKGDDVRNAMESGGDPSV